MWIRSALTLALLSGPIQAFAADLRETVRDGVEAYGDGEFEFALSRLREAESDAGFALLAPQERVLVHKYIAYCEVAFARRDEARAAFELALAIDPALELDADKVSPKILEVFRDAKRESSAQLAPDPVETPIAIATPEPKPARFRAQPAMLVPGLPQMKRGETGKGLALFTAGAASIGALAYLQYTSVVAESYVDRAGPDQRAEMRKQAADIQTLRSAAIVPVLAVWGFSIWDANRAAMIVAGPDGAKITIAWRF